MENFASRGNFVATRGRITEREKFRRKLELLVPSLGPIDFYS